MTRWCFGVRNWRSQNETSFSFLFTFLGFFKNIDVTTVMSPFGFVLSLSSLAATMLVCLEPVVNI